jgi:hypothetical protein
MVQRIVKMIGSAYSTSGDVHVQTIYNGVEISNGPVTTTVTDVIPNAEQVTVPPLNELFQFETTTDTTGPIPVSITVTGGTLFLRNFLMNYTGFTRERQRTDPAVPIDPDDSDTYNWVVTVQPDSYYSDPNFNTVESDGILNLTKNGESWPWRANVGDMLGDWMYPINNGETVVFDFFVDPAKVVLVAPT